MTIKHVLALLTLTAGVLPLLHAADAPARDLQNADQAVIVAEAKSMPVVSAPVSSTAGKTREQVIGELIEAIKDGSYVAPSELYPAIASGVTRR